MSYRLRDYEELIGALSHRKIVGIADFFRQEPADRQRSLLLRHDVDRLVWRAVEMARTEAALSVKSTYYFRCRPTGRFPIKAIETIRAFGHEVGYHYECLSACRGDRTAALTQFIRNLHVFRSFAPCHSVAMHGAPLSAYNNQDLLIGCDLQDFDLVADASLSFSETPLAYFTDTGGRWNAGGSLNFRDRVGSNFANAPAPNEPDFVTWSIGFRKPIYISTHPERWPSSRGGYLAARQTDILINLAKQVLRNRHKVGSGAPGT